MTFLFFSFLVRSFAAECFNMVNMLHLLFGAENTVQSQSVQRFLWKLPPAVTKSIAMKVRVWLCHESKVAQQADKQWAETNCKAL